MAIRKEAQRGAATLLVAVVLLAAITLITLFTARSSLFEQRISGNESRARQAMETAEAGLQQTFAYLNAKGPFCDAATGGDVVLNSTDDWCGEATCPAYRVVLHLLNRCEPGDACYDAAKLCLAEDERPLISVRATGFSDDSSATRIITQLIGDDPPIANAPKQPIITRGNMTLSGNLTIINHYSNITIWSGASVIGNASASGGSSQTLIQVNGVPYVVSSEGTDVGPDVVQNDPTLANATSEEFFQNFFNEPKAVVEAQADIHLPADGDAALDEASGKRIWVEGDYSLGTDIGTPEAPVVMVVNGSLDLTGNTVVWGVIYVTGDLNKGAGNVLVHGSMVVEGDVDLGTGSFVVDYAPLDQLGEDGVLNAVGAISGGWIDYCPDTNYDGNPDCL